MSAARGLLVLQHVACEPPAAFEDELRERGIPLRRVEVDEGEPIPDPRRFDGVVAMGGPMGAYEDRAYPWLAAEKRLIADAVEEGVPFWGVCLGAQLLAGSLGGAVFRGERPEIGMLDVQLTADGRRDPVFGGAPERFPTLQWHSDTYELPPGAVHLAQSELYVQQAFRYANAYGLQFHLEVSPALAEEWSRVPAYAQALDAVRGPGSLAPLLAEVTRAAAQTNALARALFGRWLDQIVAARPPVTAATG